MRIPRLLIPLAVAAVLAGCAGAGQEAPAPGQGWEPDDGLQRAQAALKDDTPTRLVLSGAPHVGSGVDQTLETGGDEPYRFDIVCDSPDVPEVTALLTRGTSKKQVDIACAGGEAQRIDFPAGAPVSVTVAPATGDPTPLGLIAWNLKTLDPANVQGCADEIKGC